jgi:uncharacterized cupin superfamily protein
MSITHIVSPALVAASEFDKAPPTAAVGDYPVPQLATREAFESPTGTVATGIWEATPGRFRRAVMDAEFSHFVAGRATFETEDGRTFEFRAGDAAYFPPNSLGVWTIHETLRKTYCIWK